METKDDAIDENIVEESSIDFYHQLKTDDDTINACCSQNIEKCMQIKGQDTKTEIKTAFLFHNEFFSNLEELKYLIEEDLIEMDRIVKSSSLEEKGLEGLGGDQEDDFNNHDSPNMNTDPDQNKN